MLFPFFALLKENKRLIQNEKKANTFLTLDFLGLIGHKGAVCLKNLDGLEVIKGLGRWTLGVRDPSGESVFFVASSALVACCCLAKSEVLTLYFLEHVLRCWIRVLSGSSFKLNSQIGHAYKADFMSPNLPATKIK